MMNIIKAELVYKHQLQLGEGAYWHADWKKFLYVDINEKRLGILDPVNKTISEHLLTKKPGAVFAAGENKLLIALEDAIVLVDFPSGKTEVLADIEKDILQNRCNDGACDIAGRLWIGTMNVFAKANEGSLYCFDGKELVKMINGTTVSNGICWSPDNKVMYYIDSFEYNIRAFDYDVDTGNISNVRVVVSINEKGLTADGMCADEEGNLWVAMWGGGCVNCYNPGNGDLISKIIVSAPHVTNCSFGGENNQQLFITTAREGLSEKELDKYPLSGSLFIAETGKRGLPLYAFRQKMNF